MILFEINPWIWLLISTHLTTLCLSVWLHRSLTHRALTLNPVLEHIMRFWLWAFTATDVRVWVVIHRYHHSRSDQPEDPHSPHNEGLWNMLVNGIVPSCVRTLKSKPELFAQLSSGVPDDWMQRNVYDRFPRLGFCCVLLLDTALCGVWGVWVWIGHMIWGAAAERGFAVLSHQWGYRNYNLSDRSTNWSPWGIFILGEELHNNHHERASSARFSRRWWEIDPSWWFIQLAVWLKLARLRNQHHE